MEILFELTTSIYLKIDDFLLVGGVYLHSFIIPDVLQLCVDAIEVKTSILVMFKYLCQTSMFFC